MKVENLLGLARRAGRLAAGTGPAERSAARREAKALVVAQDAAPRVHRHARRYAREYGIPLFEWGTKALLGAAIGKGEVGIVAILDERFALALKNVLGDSVEHEKGLR